MLQSLKKAFKRDRRADVDTVLETDQEETMSPRSGWHIEYIDQSCLPALTSEHQCQHMCTLGNGDTITLCGPSILEGILSRGFQSFGPHDIRHFWQYCAHLSMDVFKTWSEVIEDYLRSTEAKATALIVTPAREIPAYEPSCSSIAVLPLAPTHPLKTRFISEILLDMATSSCDCAVKLYAGGTCLGTWFTGISQTNPVCPCYRKITIRGTLAVPSDLPLTASVDPADCTRTVGVRVLEPPHQRKQCGFWYAAHTLQPKPLDMIKGVYIIFPCSVADADADADADHRTTWTLVSTGTPMPLSVPLALIPTHTSGVYYMDFQGDREKCSKFTLGPTGAVDVVNTAGDHLPEVLVYEIIYSIVHIHGSSQTTSTSV